MNIPVLQTSHLSSTCLSHYSIYTYTEYKGFPHSSSYKQFLQVPGKYSGIPIGIYVEELPYRLWWRHEERRKESALPLTSISRALLAEDTEGTSLSPYFPLLPSCSSYSDPFIYYFPGLEGGVTMEKNVDESLFRAGTSL